MAVHASRITIANSKPVDPQASAVVYWMSASLRVHENPALTYAIEQANKLSKPLIVYFGLAPYPSAQKAHYMFIIEALPAIGRELAQRGIQFIAEQRVPIEGVLDLNACCIICDELHTRFPAAWRATLAAHAPVQVVLIESNVIVPVRVLGREHYAAHTIRPKLWELAPTYMQETPLPALKNKTAHTNVASFSLDMQDRAAKTVTGGEAQAHKLLQQFITRINNYEQRNDPSIESTSHLSAYLHFGMISPVTIVQAISQSATPRTEEQVKAFIEQTFIRRELAHNFTHYNAHYDTTQGLADWAQRTLHKHSSDKREFTYTLKELEAANTHDELWNAAQRQLVRTGYMHNYMRMLWAKKILEWTDSPNTAFKYAVSLNDTYELDGRDPNGYAGIAWSIGGKHDRPWFERAIFGTVRYMSTTAAAKKFDAHKYIAAYAKS